jgi:hypothetical protein
MQKGITFGFAWRQSDEQNIPSSHSPIERICKNFQQAHQLGGQPVDNIFQRF